MGARLPERSVWQATKAVYSSLIAQSIRFEIAESFFNSLTRRVFATEGVDQAIEFVDTDFDVPPSEHDGELCRRYHGAPLPDLLANALTDADGAALRESAGAISTAQWPPRPSAFPRQLRRSRPATLEVFQWCFLSRPGRLPGWSHDQWRVGDARSRFVCGIARKAGSRLTRS